MKKLLSILLTLAMVLSMVACGSACFFPDRGSHCIQVFLPKRIGNTCFDFRDAFVDTIPFLRLFNDEAPVGIF